MENRKPAAERIRPILEAMERSIDSARRRRTLGDAPAPQPAPAQPPSNDDAANRTIGSPGSNPIGSIPRYSHNQPPSAPPIVNQPPRTESGERLKARPKRPQNLNSAHSQSLPPYHSRAS